MLLVCVPQSGAGLQVPPVHHPWVEAEAVAHVSSLVMSLAVWLQGSALMNLSNLSKA